ncbi:MAG: hypothetical protein IT285_09625 [Bdellovibrionales bacterium]|nr:hypothetical protein [Bdellovibrionales bacterium]
MMRRIIIAAGAFGLVTLGACQSSPGPSGGVSPSANQRAQVTTSAALRAQVQTAHALLKSTPAPFARDLAWELIGSAEGIQAISELGLAPSELESLALASPSRASADALVELYRTESALRGTRVAELGAGNSALPLLAALADLENPEILKHADAPGAAGDLAALARARQSVASSADEAVRLRLADCAAREQPSVPQLPEACASSIFLGLSSQSPLVESIESELGLGEPAIVTPATSVPASSWIAASSGRVRYKRPGGAEVTVQANTRTQILSTANPALGIGFEDIQRVANILRGWGARGNAWCLARLLSSTVFACFWEIESQQPGPQPGTLLRKVGLGYQHHVNAFGAPDAVRVVLRASPARDGSSRWAVVRNPGNLSVPPACVEGCLRPESVFRDPHSGWWFYRVAQNQRPVFEWTLESSPLVMTWGIRESVLEFLDGAAPSVDPAEPASAIVPALASGTSGLLSQSFLLESLAEPGSWLSPSLEGRRIEAGARAVSRLGLLWAAAAASGETGAAQPTPLSLSIAALANKVATVQAPLVREELRSVGESMASARAARASLALAVQALQQLSTQQVFSALEEVAASLGYASDGINLSQAQLEAGIFGATEVVEAFHSDLLRRAALGCETLRHLGVALQELAELEACR